jgi:hypothetical protein
MTAAPTLEILEKLACGKRQDMLAKRTRTPESAVRNRAVRIHLGEQLRAYYDSMQSAAPSDRLADLIEHLAQRLEQQRSSPENSATE